MTTTENDPTATVPLVALDVLDVLVLGNPADPQLAALALRATSFDGPADVHFFFGESPADFGREILARAEAVLCWWRGRDALDPVLAAAPRLRWIHASAAGLDHLTSPALAASGATLTNSRGVYGDALAEYVIAAMLHFAKDLTRLHDAQARRAWEPFDGERLAGKVLAIVGYGDIGQAIAARARAFDVQVVAHRRRPELSAGDPHVTRMARDLRDAVTGADFVVLATPLTDDNRRFFDAEALSWLRPGAVLINVGRGPAVDEPALVAALQRGALRGAALDVFETEPLPPEHPFWAMPQVLISPHCADRVAGWLDRTMDLFLDNLARFTRGAPLRNVVDARRGY
jgi:phosphoglycerate dehydrogenase-like enzyme